MEFTSLPLANNEISFPKRSELIKNHSDALDILYTTSTMENNEEK
jgi:hypothetical protein